VLHALADVLANGLAKTKASRTPDDPVDFTDAAEFTRWRVMGVHAEV